MNRFFACKSYKKGKYVLGKYKKFDFFLLILSVVIAGIILTNSTDLEEGFTRGLLIVGITVTLVSPEEKYHSIYYQLFYIVKRNLKMKPYIFKGVEYEFRKNKK